VPTEIWIGLALWILFEGLVLFAAPRAVQKMMLDMAQAEPRKLRLWGGGMVFAGLVILQLARMA
jgi:uncharacterized protein